MQATGSEMSALTPFLMFLGGIAAHELARRILFPKKENGNGSSRAQLELDIRDAVQKTFNESLLPILNNQTQILQQVATATTKTSEAVAVLAALEKVRGV